MSIFSKLSNKNAITSFSSFSYENPYYWNSSEMLRDQLLARMISSSLASCSHKDRFNLLYSYDLVPALVKLLVSGELKVFLYCTLEKENGMSYKKAFLMSEDVLKKSELESKDLIVIEVNIKEANTRLSHFLTFLCQTLSILFSQTSSNIILSNLLNFKINDARQVIPSDYNESVKATINKAFKDAINGESGALFMDGGDSLEAMKNEMLSNDNLAISTISNYLSLGTGFPASFFNGVFDANLGGTNQGDREMLYFAKETFFFTYLKPFFNEISNQIAPVKNMADYFQPKEIIDLANYDDRIDIEEVYKQFSIPLKVNESKV